MQNWLKSICTGAGIREEGEERMGLMKKRNSEKEPVSRRVKALYIFTFLMVALFGLIVYAMLAILILVTTYYDVEALTYGMGRFHNYYQKQEKRYLEQVCQEYKNMNLVVETGLKKGIPAEEVINEVETTSLALERYLILNKEGKVVYPANWDGNDFSEREMSVLADQNRPLVREKQGVHLVYYSGGIRDGDRIIVLEDKDSFVDCILNHRTSWAAQCENVAIGRGGVIIPLSKSTGKIYYKPEGMEDLQFPDKPDAMKDGSISFLSLGGKDYFCYSRVMADNDTVLAALIPVGYLISSVSGMTIVCTMIFALAMGVILVYAMTMIRLKKKGVRVYRWKELPKGFVYDRRAGRQMMLYASLILTSMAIMTFYVLTLAGISVNSARASAQLRKVVNNYDKASGDAKKAEKFIREKRESFLRMMIISNMKNDDLKRDVDDYLNQSANIYSICFYDVDGKLLYSSDPVTGEMTQEEKKELNEIREGVVDSFTVISGVKGGNGIPEYRNMAAILLDHEEAAGYFVIKIAENALPKMLNDSLLKDELLSVRTGNGGTAFAINYKTGAFSYDETGRLVGKDALKCGLKSGDLQGEFSGFLNYNGVRKYAVSVLEKSQYIYLAMEEWEMLITRLPTVAISLIAGVICIFCFFVSATVRKKKEGESLPEEEPESEGNVRGSAHAVHVVKVMKWIGFSMAVLVTLSYLFYDVLLPETSILYYIFEGNWDKGLNIFSFTMCIVTICGSVVLISLISRLLEMVAEILSRRGETICRLLTSLIKYLGILVVIFLCIANCGVNMRTLTVSAGIMGTVLGLGTTSLLSDIFAGLFMTFEGDMQVGDAMIIDGFLGRIVEIGIRTTKFIDSDESTLIVNNHMLMGPVKRARTYNYCHSYINMDYDESLDRVEAFLAAELPGLKKKLPFLLSEPEYRGVVSLLDQRMQIDIRYRASAADRFMAEREMNRELKLIFDKYHLSLNITEDYRMTDIVYLPKNEGDTEVSQDFLKKRWKGRIY